MTLSGVELLSDLHRLDRFECGKPALDHWLANVARSNQLRGFTRVLVVLDEGQVIGYYGLAASVIEPNAAPRHTDRPAARSIPLSADRSARCRPESTGGIPSGVSALNW